MSADENANVYVVLVVDSDVSVHPTVKKALPDSCAFLGARTAELALRLASKRTPSLALLSDELPSPGYADLVAKLREISPSMRVMMLSASREPAETSRLVKLGPLIAKPIVPGRLVDAIASVLKLCKMSASVGHLLNESVNVQTWSASSITTRGGSAR
jgi:DNA-binding response OmpR family regulator